MLKKQTLKNHPFDYLNQVIRKLRSPAGCPWDRKQTIKSLKEFLLEETYELLEAMASRSLSKHKEELGDLLLQIMLQSEIRRQQGKFCITDVINSLTEKLIRRHPHVFGKTKARNVKTVLKNWEQIKSSEKKNKKRKSIMDGIPKSMPALLKALKIQRRAARMGFDWKDYHGVISKIKEENNELIKAITTGKKHEIEHEIGDLFFSMINLCRHFNIDPDSALNKCIKRFSQRFTKVEQMANKYNLPLHKCSLKQLDDMWEKAKNKVKRK